MRIPILFVWWLFATCFAQTQADTLFSLAMKMPNDSVKVKQINEIAFSIMRSQASSAFDFAEKALALAEEINYPAGMAKATYILAVIHLQLGQRDDALANYISALQLCNQHGLRAQKGDVLRGMGNYFREIGDKEASQNYTRQSIAIARELGDSLGVAKGLSNLGILKLEANHLNYILQAASIMEQLLSQGNTNARYEFLVLIYNNISSQYSDIDSIKQAIIYSDKAIKLNEKNQNPYNTTLAYLQLADIYNRTQQYPLALQAALKALDIVTSTGTSDITAARLQAMICGTYFNLKNYPAALQHCEKACTIFKELENIEELIIEIYSMSEILVKMNKEDIAILKINEAYTLATANEIPLLAGRCAMLAGQILVAQQKDAEALVRFQQCLRLHEQKDLADEDLIAVCKSLAALYERGQQPEKAAEIQRRLESLSAQ